MKYIIGNWKSNLSINEIQNWFKVILSEYKNSKLSLTNLEIIVCPPFVYLQQVKEFIIQYQLPFKLGAQNISPFPNGAYTGEVSAAMLSEFVQYVIIGHSERRNYFHDDERVLSEKVKRAIEAGLKIIYCIPDEETYIPDTLEIVAYEPVWAIGTGKSDTPENAGRIGNFFKKKKKLNLFVYGGSVTPSNIVDFLSQESIDGVLPGKSSLDPLSFWEMIVRAGKL